MSMTNTAPATDPAIAYTATREQIAGLIHNLNARIEARYTRHFDDLNWTDVATLNYVAELLEQADRAM